MRRRTAPTLATIVNSQVRRVLADRYKGQALPDDDAGREDLAVAVQALANKGTGEPDVRRYVETAAPWLRAMDVDLLVDRAYTRPLFSSDKKQYKPDLLARLLGVDYATRTRLAVFVIGSNDVPKPERKARAAAKRIEQQRARRRAQGRQPRDEWLAERYSRTKPWEGFRVSRRTWERWGKPDLPCRRSEACILPYAASHLRQEPHTKRAGKAA